MRERGSGTGGGGGYIGGGGSKWLSGRSVIVTKIIQTNPCSQAILVFRTSKTVELCHKPM